VSPEQLRRAFNADDYTSEKTECVEPLSGIIGQKRALQALTFGLGIREQGYNIYVAGPPGIGKMTAVKAYLESRARAMETPPDWCYVNDFADPYQPVAISLPAGRGRGLQQDMKELVAHLRRDVRRAFESDEYGSRLRARVDPHGAGHDAHPRGAPAEGVGVPGAASPDARGLPEAA
jgi:hypothetical protein